MTVNFRKASDVPPSSASADKPPRRGRPPGSGGGRKSSKSLRKGIDGLLVVLNTIIQTVRPIDALDGAELATLGKALDEQAKVSPRFRRGLESLLSVTGGTALIPVLGLIVSRRLARHHMVPAAIDPLGGVILQMMQAEPSEAAEAMDTIQHMMAGIRPTNDETTNDGAADAAAS